MSRVLKQSETVSLINKVNFSGLASEDFYLSSGSRMLVTLLVLSIDSGASIAATVENTFSLDDPYDVLETINTTTTGRFKRVFSDFHNQFKINVNVTGGNATFKVGVSVFDNALSTKIENAEISVDLTHTEDSVRIGDGTRLLTLNDDGSVPVSDANATNEARVDLFNEISLVATGSDQTILQYQVPVGVKAHLFRCDVSGENIAKYTLFKGTNPISIKRTYFGAPLNVEFDFKTSHKQGLELQAGDIIKINVIHNRPDPANFEASFQIVEVTL